MVAETETAEVQAPASTARNVLSRLVAVIGMIRQETVHQSVAVYDAISNEISELVKDAAHIEAVAEDDREVLGAVVAHLKLDPHNPLQSDISLAAPAATGQDHTAI